ncbi:MAG: hypothetical protein QOI24_1382 [Acidobacteriota bacterium]|jgi:hypothetical protein|nr:hypothetical protein [Acidobacteriota bacterium]
MSSTGVYRCCDDERRDLVRAQSALNGIDFLEVVDHDEPVLANRQRFLRIHFVNSPPPAAPALPATLKDLIVIDGGERIRNIVVKDATYDGDVLVVEVVARGDFSPYTLRLVQPTTRTPLAGIDPPLSTIDFSFKVECESDFDCRVPANCPPDSDPTPRIDYLARDYGSFRRLMLDRISLLVPGWRERTAADLGVTLVELLAYVADRLAYEQDAIATEAYLGTARRRTSVRRHARLVDYLLRDGCNARVFVHVNVGSPVTLPLQTQFLTRLDGVDKRIEPGAAQREALARGPLVFESMVETNLEPDQNLLTFYTWGSRDCCLECGATSATLLKLPKVSAGDFLLFGEVLGPRTGSAADADRTHRHVVRLTRAAKSVDTLTGTPITEIEWDEADALPFPLCISATIRDADGAPLFLSNVTIAVGNLVIADHGESVPDVLGVVPEPRLFRPPAASGDFCEPAGAVAVLPRFSPRLHFAPLTQSAPLDPTSAHSVLHWPMDDVLPSIALFSPDGIGLRNWEPRHDLLESESDKPHFVADVEDDGFATIRFGDGDYGLRPSSGTPFTATYRIGNGIAGNLGPDSLTHIVSSNTDVNFAWNPLGGTGGVEPEAIEHARRAAPAAFRNTRERAVTEADYAEVTERHPAVDRAAATFRWTGSWFTVFDSVDRPGGLEVDDAFRELIRAHVERYRVIGKDVEVLSPLFVSMEIALSVCVRPGHFRAEVESELRDLFTAGVRRDGRPGFFHPDNFTFGEPVIMSRVIAAAANVEGVDAVVVDRFRRQGQPRTDARDTGVLSLGRLEIARLENNRSFPEHGSLTLTMRGGV